MFLIQFDPTIIRLTHWKKKTMIKMENHEIERFRADMKIHANTFSYFIDKDAIESLFYSIYQIRHDNFLDYELGKKIISASIKVAKVLEKLDKKEVYILPNCLEGYIEKMDVIIATELLKNQVQINTKNIKIELNKRELI